MLWGDQCCAINKEEKACDRVNTLAPADPTQSEQQPQEAQGPASPSAILPLWPYSADDTALHLKSMFDASDLGRIVSSIHESDPVITKGALELLVREEINILRVCIREKLSRDIADQVESIMCDLGHDTSLQQKLAKSLTGMLENPPCSELQGASSTANDPAWKPSGSEIFEPSLDATLATETLAIKAPKAFPPLDKVPISVQFGSSVYYAEEDKGYVDIDIVRIGDSTGTSRAHYTTVDASAMAGIKYKAAVGDLEFRPGELSKSVRVTILSDERWDSTLEFMMVLSAPQGCSLGATLFKCRVKILDDDAFPTNRFKEIYKQQGLPGIPKIQLFFEFLKMLYLDIPIRRASYWCMLFDQVQNLHTIWYLVVKLYLLDVVLNPEREEAPLIDNRVITLFLIAAVIIGPQTMMSVIMGERVNLRVGGMCRKKLQANLLRKFLNYDECLRSAVGLSDLMLSITHHSPDLIQNGYLCFLKIVQEFGMMLLFGAYQVALCARQKSLAAAVSGLVPLVIFPACMLTFLILRHPESDRLKMRMMLAEKKFASEVETVATHARMIIDYQSRAKTMDKVEDDIKILNGSINASHGNHTLNMQFAPWIASVVIGVYIFVSGSLVLDGGLSLGAFVVTVDMYQRIATSWDKVYNVALTMHSALPALELIFWHMNLPTDQEKRSALNVICQEMGVGEREIARANKKDEGVLYAIDMLPIKLREVRYLYHEFQSNQYAAEVSQTMKSSKPQFHATKSTESIESLGEASLADFPGIKHMNLRIEQGSLVVFVGKRGQGKTTLLKVVGGVLIPEGDFYMPMHLRVVHVLQQPVFLDVTLLENLRYGIRPDSDDGKLDRVLLICRRLLVAEAVIKLIIGEELHQWNDHLSLTQKTSLHLARALVANPDVLVLHKPMLVFDAASAHTLMETLKEYVDNRGLFVEGDIRLRRRKTCFFTTTRTEGCSIADKIFLVSKNGAHEVQADQITDDMLC